MTQLNIPLDSKNGDKPTELATIPIGLYHLARHGEQELGAKELLPFRGYEPRLYLLSYRDDDTATRDATGKLVITKGAVTTVWLSTSNKWTGARNVQINADRYKAVTLKLIGSFMTLEQVGKDHLPGQTVYVYQEA